jgi:FkbM family methyltransferase
MLAALFRFILYPLITFRPTYLLGMVLVRLSRKIKARTIKSTKELVTISNFMYNIKMRVDKNSYMGGAIYWCGFHHINELLFLRGFLRSDMTFVDVGANQGEFTLYACSKLTNGKVLAFEPTSYQLGLLQTNIGLNNFKNVEVHSYGLYQEEAKLEVYTSYDTSVHSGTNEGLSSLYKSESRQEVEEVIDLKVFDTEYFDKLTRLDVVKVDVEGAELFVLKGMIKSLEKFKPLLLIEMNKKTFEDAGYTMEDVVQFLEDLNYRPFKLFRGKIYEITRKDLVDFSNVVFKTIGSSDHPERN